MSDEDLNAQALRLELAKAASQLVRRDRRMRSATSPQSRRAVLFFQLINAASMPSNKGFEEWDEILGDEVMAQL